MPYFRLIPWVFILLATSATLARAEDTPPQRFFPLAGVHRIGGNNLSVPHFMPLSARPAARILTRPATEAPEAEADIPAPQGHSSSDPMTQEQAKQILSIFGEAE